MFTQALKKTGLLIAMGALMVGASAGAMAQDKNADWNKTHPRRTEVNDRLKNQDKRIHAERKEGEINKAQAAKLHREDHHIRKEERAMAAKDGGHITRQDQRKLNAQENGVSKQIGQ